MIYESVFSRMTGTMFDVKKIDKYTIYQWLLYIQSGNTNSSLENMLVLVLHVLPILSSIHIWFLWYTFSPFLFVIYLENINHYITFDIICYFRYLSREQKKMNFNINIDGIVMLFADVNFTNIAVRLKEEEEKEKKNWIYSTMLFLKWTFEF